MLQIPFIEYPAYTKEIVLDSKSYIFSFVWNTRGEFWTLSIADINKVTIINGIKIVLNYNLLQDFHHLDVPPGDLYVLDLSTNVSKIQYSDFTNERQLVMIYQELSDLV
jgi:hypothetical protein